MPHTAAFTEVTRMRRGVAFFEHATRTAAKFKVDVILGDMNARLGSITVPGIGPHGWAQQEDENGALLRKMITELELKVVSTLHPATSEGYTWLTRKHYHNANGFVEEREFKPFLKEMEEPNLH